MVEDLLVIFDGLYGYVLLIWYSQLDGVFIWNYIILQVLGKVEFIKMELEFFVLLERFSQVSEVCYVGSWLLDQLDEFRVRMLMKQIVFFRIKIMFMEGKVKLS